MYDKKRILTCSNGVVSSGSSGLNNPSGSGVFSPSVNSKNYKSTNFNSSVSRSGSNIGIPAELGEKLMNSSKVGKMNNSVGSNCSGDSNFKFKYTQMANQLKVNKSSKDTKYKNKDKLQIINSYNPSLLEMNVNDGCSTNINININNISEKKDPRSMISFRNINEDVDGPEELHMINVELAKQNKLLAYKFDKVSPRDDV